VAARGRGGTLGRLQPSTNGSLFISAPQCRTRCGLYGSTITKKKKAQALPPSLLLMPQPPADENLTEQPRRGKSEKTIQHTHKNAQQNLGFLLTLIFLITTGARNPSSYMPSFA
jgi:hypothetical protein